ncbi:MAG TPA: hypothetical protein VNJ03_09595 [Vicinamibacterales bacterium]|nr:hypothetical protein [Vicinamibacterales bacterium]
MDLHRGEGEKPEAETQLLTLAKTRATRDGISLRSLTNGSNLQSCAPFGLLPNSLDESLP